MDRLIKIDVILIRPPRRGLKSNFISTQEPINICYLAAYLEREGVGVDVWDLEREEFNDEEFISRLKNISPLFVGFSCYTPSILSANRLAELIKIKLPQITTVVGGPHASALPEETLYELSGFDIVIIGEGEKTLLDLVTQPAATRNYKDIKGIAYRENEKVIKTPPAHLIEDLDSIPPPARHLLKPDLYRNIQPTRGFSTKGKKITSLYTSRGCPAKCIFCAVNVGFGHRVRFRSVASVLSEVEECINKYNIDHFIIQDDTFNLKPKRLTALLEGFIDLGVKSWSCDARVDLMTKDMLAQMVKAGCKKISFGVESGSPRILELNKKGIKLEQVRNVVKWSREVGLDCVETTFMIGSHPDETIEDVMLTQKLMKELNPDIVFLSVLVPYPGTEVHSIMKDRGFIFANDWDDFVMFGSVPKWRTTHFEPEALVQTQQKILRNYYFRPSYILKRLLKLRSKHEIIYWIQSGLGFLQYTLSQLWRRS